MSADVQLQPGLTPLVDWRAIYRGASLALDPYARPDVEAGVAAFAKIGVSEQLLPPEDPLSVAELMEADGDRLPSSLVRLAAALKLASLTQGTSGVRWKTLTGIANFISADLLPMIPNDKATDRAALACLFAALTGTGELVHHEKCLPATKALKAARLRPLHLTPWERQALVSGNHLTTATALAGLFEAELIFQSALVVAALSTAALGRSNARLSRGAQQLLRQPGQMEVAAAWRALLAPSEPEENTEGAAWRDEPLRLGASLELLRQAGATLERAANTVSEEHLVLWQRGEIVPGTSDSSAAARAADVVALALTSLTDLSLARTAALSASNADDADHVTPHAQAAGFAARMRDHAGAGSGPRRLLPMAGMAALVLAVECLHATRLIGPERHDGSPLADVLQLLREAGADAADISSPATLAASAERIGSGALAEAVGGVLAGLTPSDGNVAKPLGGKGISP